MLSRWTTGAGCGCAAGWQGEVARGARLQPVRGRKMNDKSHQTCLDEEMSEAEEVEKGREEGGREKKGVRCERRSTGLGGGVGMGFKNGEEKRKGGIRHV